MRSQNQVDREITEGRQSGKKGGLTALLQPLHAVYIKLNLCKTATLEKTENWFSSKLPFVI